MQLSRQTFRWMLVLTAMSRTGCLPARKSSIPETLQDAWYAQPSTSGNASSGTSQPPAEQAAHAAGESATEQLSATSQPALVQPASAAEFQAVAYDATSSRASAGNGSAGYIYIAQSPSDIGTSEPDAPSGTYVPAQTHSMTVQQLESLALSNNPTLRGLAATTHKAAGYRTQVGLRANPSVGYQATQLADQGTDQHTAFIEQEFVTGGKLALNRRVQNEAVQAQLHELETQRMRILSDVRSKFYEALAAQKRIELIHDFQSVVDKGLELAELRKAALEGSQIDVLQAKVQKNEIDLAYRQAHIAFDAAWKQLAALAGVADLAPAQLSGELPLSDEPLDWSSVSSEILNTSPELQAAQARVRQARALLERHGVQAIPNLTMQMAAGVDQGTDSGLINIQVGAPIPVFNQNQGNIAAARAEYCRALMDVQRLENSIAARLAGISQSYQSASVAVTKYSQEILPNADESMALAEIAYKAGETNFVQVLIARRTYFDTTLQFIAAQTELAQARARVDGFVLTGGLDAMNDQSGDDSLRGLTFSQQ